MIDPERPHQLFDLAVERRFPGHRHVDERPKPLVSIAAVEVDDVARLFDDFLGDEVGDPLARASRRVSRIHTVQVLSVHRAPVDGPRQKRGHRGDVDHDDGAPKLGRPDPLEHPLKGQNGRVLVAVVSGDERDEPDPGEAP